MHWIDDYVNFATRISEPATIFHEWCAVSAIASCLQRKCKLNIGLLRFFPNLYIVLVGPSGCRKGTAMRITADMISDIKGIYFSCQSTTREALIKNLKRSKRTDTIDGKLVIDSSFTIHSEELTVFLGYNNLQLITDITDWYDGGTGKQGVWAYETIGRGKEDINGMWVNLLGATTPQAIQSSLPMEAVGIGLANRMIFVYADKRARADPFPVLTPADIEIQKNLQDRLEDLLLVKGNYSVTNKFIEEYSKWYLSHDLGNPFNDSRFSGYVDRRASHIWKLCMIMNAARTSDMVIDIPDFEKSLDLLVRTEKDMSKVFSGYGKRPGIDVMTRLMQDLATYEKMSFDVIMRKYYKEVDNDSMLSIISSLESMGFAKSVRDAHGNHYIIYTEAKDII